MKKVEADTLEEAYQKAATELVCSITDLEYEVIQHPSKGILGVGHVRWATHGVPSKVNAHPHSSEQVSVVHNGIIENSNDLKKDLENKIYLEKTDLDLSGISAIKISPDELECLTNQHEDAGMKELQKRGIENVILTNKQYISLLSNDKIYTIKLPNLELFDRFSIKQVFKNQWFSYKCGIWNSK